MEETDFEELYYQKCAHCEMFIDAMVRMNNALKSMESSQWHLQCDFQELTNDYDCLKEENERLEAENAKLRKEKYESVPALDENPTEE